MKNMPRGTLPKETIEYRLLRGENHGSIPHVALLIKNMPRGGIEPPTRGFSVPCSTD